MSRAQAIAILLCMIPLLARTEYQSSEADFLRKQELVFQLLWSTSNIPKNHPEIFERARNFKLEDVAIACANQTYAEVFQAHLKNGALARGQAFSIFRKEHLEDVRTLFDVFHDAKSFDDFLTLATWSSLVVNEGVWLHALAVAVAQRSDTENVRLPNLYEILPHYFFNIDVIVQAYRIKTEEVPVSNGAMTIEANYSGQFPPLEEEEEYKLSYFHEDVGLNAFYFAWISSFPFWLSSERLGQPHIPRGEFYYHVHKTLVARHELELLSHGLGPVEVIDWTQEILTGYHPSMTHSNGLLFPTRASRARVPGSKYQTLQELRHQEARIARALDLGELRTGPSTFQRLYEAPGGEFEKFCCALEGNADSPAPTFYGSLDRNYRRVLGFAPEAGAKHRPVPAALETSLTCLRDPGFFRLAKRIVDYGLKFKRNLSNYKFEELNFNGVRIDYIHVDPLVTFMDEFTTSLNHPRVLDLHDDHHRVESDNFVKVRQKRLNHKHCSYQIGVSSERSAKAIVRVFIGPRTDIHGNDIDLDESADKFYELDRWTVELKQGSNTLERSLADSVYGVADSEGSATIYRFLGLAAKPTTSDEASVHRALLSSSLGQGFPRRLLLPRGSQRGLRLRLLVCLHELNHPAAALGRSLVFPKMHLDNRALGFPLDRPLANSNLFNSLRNFMLKDVVVYHEDAKDVKKD